MATVADIFSQIPPQLLDTVVSDQHVVLIAEDMIKWEQCASILGLTQAKQEEIRANHPGDYALQKQASLFKWKQAQASNAKYRILFITFCSLGMSDLAQKLKCLLLHVSDESASQRNVLENFQLYLQECYTAACFAHPSQTQWPFSALQSYVDLSLFDAPLSDDLLSVGTENDKKEKQALKEIKLENLFLAGNRQAKRKVLLLEGVAGSGKTTLSWHSCKKWAAGELFQHIKLFIHVSLNNPEIASAKSLADIIPHPDEGMRVAVAKAIADECGKDVCFFFDACDENPEVFRRGFLSDFIKGKGRAMLPCCSIVMAARPEIHLKVPVTPLLTAHVITCGFDLSKLKEFIESSLRCHQELKVQIYHALKLNSELVGLCSLPLNAVILIHLFSSLKDNLPTTRTSLFKPMICNLLIRHIHNTKEELIQIEEFSDLPPIIHKKFKAVCSLAFSAFTKRKRLISKDMLKVHKLSSSVESMGLMVPHQQLVGYCGPKHYYSFLHLSLQEFLAAVHISEMDEDKQTLIVQQILQTTPLSPVLPFYAGLTKLSNKGALDKLLEVTKKPLDIFNIFERLSKNPVKSNDDRRSSLALLNCIYEAQNPVLCELVRPPIPTFVENPFNMSCLSLEGLNLGPLDFLSAGYFLGNASHLALDLTFCFSDTGLYVMIKQLITQTLLRKSQATNWLYISLDSKSSETVQLLKELIEYVAGLAVRHGVSSDVLKNITEGIYNSSGLQYLELWSPSSSGLYYLILLLTCQNLKMLSLDDVKIDKLFAEAVKYSTVADLSMGYKICNIDDNDLNSLAGPISVNPHLTSLSIQGKCSFSSESLTSFLRQLVGSNSVLQTIRLNSDFQLTEEHCSSVNAVNKNRQKSTLSFLTPNSSVKRFEKTLDESGGVFRNLFTTHPELFN